MSRKENQKAGTPSQVLVIQDRTIVEPLPVAGSLNGGDCSLDYILISVQRKLAVRKTEYKVRTPVNVNTKKGASDNYYACAFFFFDDDPSAAAAASFASFFAFFLAFRCSSVSTSSCVGDC